MSAARAYGRLAGVLLWSAFSHCLVVLTIPLRRLAPALQLRLRNAIFRRWGRVFCRLAGTRVRVEGTPPSGRFFLVSNHMSYMDIPLLAGFLDAVFVAKADLRGWPLAGRIIHTSDNVFVDRSRKRDLVRAGQEVEKRLARGLGVVLFPEATSGSGADLLPFKGSLLEHAARSGLPVHVATIHYAVPPGSGCTARDRVCWWGDTPLFPHLPRLLALPYHEAILRFAAEPVVHQDRKNLRDELETAMRAIFTPVE